MTVNKIELTHKTIIKSFETINLGLSTSEKSFEFIVFIDLNPKYDLMNPPDIKEYRLSVESYYNLLCGDKSHHTDSQIDFTIKLQAASTHQEQPFSLQSIPEKILQETIYEGIGATVSCLDDFYRSNSNICPNDIDGFLKSLQDKEAPLKNVQVLQNNLTTLPESCLITEQNKKKMLGTKDAYSAEW